MWPSPRTVYGVDLTVHGKHLIMASAVLKKVRYIVVSGIKNS